MTDHTAPDWTLTASDGDLRIHTDVGGRAARTGHRLTIALTSWTATVTWSGDAPSSVRASIDVDSLEVLRGEGGLTPMSGPEKVVARGNALKSLDARKYPEITFVSSGVAPSASGYRITGDLTIHGTAREHVVELAVSESDDGAWQLAFEVPLAQTDFGVKPYSLMMGTLKVADEVRVTLDARREKAS